MHASQQPFRMSHDHALLSTWRAQLAQAPSRYTQHQLAQQEQVLLPRFAAYYGQLQHLPRRMRRALQRQWKRSLAGMALLLTLGQAPALAATLTVSGPAQTHNVIAICSLVDAITAANSDTATGGCPAGSGADMLVLPSGSTQALTAVNNYYGGYLSSAAPTGLPVITSIITIEGNGSTIRRIAGSPDFRILAVGETGRLTLRNTTVSGGRTSDNRQPGGGVGVFGSGAIPPRGGRLTLISSTVSGNETSGDFSCGGGIFNGNYFDLGFGYTSTTTLINSTVSGNSTSGVRSAGGGICNSARFYGGSLSITDSTISNNATLGDGADGGGVTSFYGTVIVTRSTLSGNTTSGDDASGGGLFSYSSDSSIRNSTISGNSTSGAFSPGGGMDSRGRYSFIDISDSTVSGNGTSGSDSPGGGLFNDIDNPFPDPEITLTRILLSGNTSASGARELHNTPDSVLNADNFNLFGHSGDAGVVGFTPGPTDIVPSGPVSSILSALADNGGLTRTHNLVAGGPAVDAAGASCSATDQRGVIRPRGSACDIGGVEVVICNGLAARVGTLGDDVIFGTQGVDVIHGLSGNNTINGLGGGDSLCGGNGNDLFNGGLGNDVLIGGLGVDTARFFGFPAVSVNLTGGTSVGQGSDTLIGIENVNGSSGNDTLVGNAAANTLNGGPGNDNIFGVGGNDLLFGFTGDDALNGGGGTDICNGGPHVNGDSATACEATVNVP